MPDYVPCPECQSPSVEKVNFTWWGGVLGPSLLTHVKCQNCGTTFNGKTGQPNTVPIIIYSAVMFVLFFIVFLLLFRLL